MKTNKSILTCVITSVLFCSFTPGQESIESLIKDRLDRSVQQYRLMAESLIDRPEKLPATIDANGKLRNAWA